MLQKYSILEEARETGIPHVFVMLDWIFYWGEKNKKTAINDLVGTIHKIGINQ